jgi:hypothetical protein
MQTAVYRYVFSEAIPTDEAENSLLLAILAAESLHGESQVRLDAAHCMSSDGRGCVIDAATVVGQTINRLFIGFLKREFGEDAFRVERLREAPQAPTAAAR